MIESIKDFFRVPPVSNFTLASLFISASLVSLFWSRVNNYQFIYNDSVSYLNIPRMVIDNAQSGVEQLGTIWLPLNHLTKLPFIWSDSAYQSGSAGSVISMLSYLVAVLFVFKITKFLTRSRAAAIGASIMFGFNPSWLYLQSTPMSEALFMALFLASAYTFCRYTEKRDISWLVSMATINAFMVMSRYEAWFVILIQAALIFLLYTPTLTKSFSELITRFILFLAPPAIMISLWLIWNYQITGNMFYFLNGELSASAFTERQQSSGVVAKGDIFISLRLFASASISMIGLLPILLSSSGFLSWLWRKEELQRIRQKLGSGKLNKRQPTVAQRKVTFMYERNIDQYITYKKVAKASVIFLLLSPSLFHMISLFMGYSSMKVAGIGGDVVSLNLRYSIYLLPFAAIGTIIMLKSKLYYAVSVIAVLISYGLMMTTTPEIITDALEGRIDYDKPASVIAREVDEDEQILMSFATNSPLAFHAGLDLKQYVHEGYYDGWQAALATPEEHVDWVIISERFEFDPVRERLVESPTMLQNFERVYEDDDIAMYKRITE